MAISFYTDFEPTYGEVVELAPRIRRVVAKNPNPFTWKGTGVYIVGRGDVAVIDPGPTLDEHLDAVLDALGPEERITKILITHTHTDHTAGVPKLQARTGADTYGFGPHGPVPDHDPLEQVTFDEYFSAEEKQIRVGVWTRTGIVCGTILGQPQEMPTVAWMRRDMSFSKDTLQTTDGWCHTIHICS